MNKAYLQEISNAAYKTYIEKKYAPLMERMENAADNGRWNASFGAEEIDNEFCRWLLDENFRVEYWNGNKGIWSPISRITDFIIGDSDIRVDWSI